MKFNELDIKKEMIKAVEKKGFDELTDIQEKSILPALEGKDILGQAQTGTGKTAAFSIPVLTKIDKTKKDLQCLVLVPTRELALQVKKEMESLSGALNIDVVTVYGGDPIDKQMKLLKNKPQIVVGTPGRTIDLIERKKLKIEKIDYFILDEVDEMLNMGFIDDVEFIASKAQPERQTLLFSATLPKRIQTIANKYLQNPEIIKVKSKSITADRVEQMYIVAKKKQKNLILKNLIDINSQDKIIIFTQTKKSADEVSDFLLGFGFLVGKIHGDLPQNTRSKTIDKFRKNKVKYLVATDVVARGIDIDDVSLVINYELPQDIEYYIHRIGRTARGISNTGRSITLVTPRAYDKEFRHYSKQLNTKIREIPKPKLADVINILKDKYLKEIIGFDEVDEKVYKELAEKLLEFNKAEEIIAKLLFKIYPELSKEENLKLIDSQEDDQGKFNKTRDNYRKRDNKKFGKGKKRDYRSKNNDHKKGERNHKKYHKNK